MENSTNSLTIADSNWHWCHRYCRIIYYRDRCFSKCILIPSSYTSSRDCPPELIWTSLKLGQTILFVSWSQFRWMVHFRNELCSYCYNSKLKQDLGSTNNCSNNCIVRCESVYPSDIGTKQQTILSVPTSRRSKSLLVGSLERLYS